MSIKYKSLLSLLLLLFFALTTFSYATYVALRDHRRLAVGTVHGATLERLATEIKLDIVNRVHDLPPILARIGAPGARIKLTGLSQLTTRSLLLLSVYQKTDSGIYKLVREFRNEDLLKLKGVTEPMLERLSRERPLGLDQIGENGFSLLNRSLPSSPQDGSPPGLISFVMGGKLVGEPGAGTIVTADYLNDFVRQRLSRSSLTDVFLIFDDGRLLVHSNPNATAQYALSPYPHPALAELKLPHAPQETIEIESNGVPAYLSLTQTGIGRLTLAGTIRKGEALAPIKELTLKGILLGSAVLSFCLLIGFILIQGPAAAIARIAEAVARVESGERDFLVDVHSTDELGAMARSLESLTSKLTNHSPGAPITHFDVEPPASADLLALPKIDSKACELATSIATSTSGCYFWDAVLTGEVLTVLLGEALTPGTPGTIATAISRSCFQVLSRTGHSPLSPEALLVGINRQLHALGEGKLTATALIAQLNLATGDLAAASAGQCGPLITKRGEPYFKGHVLSVEGPQLGVNAGSEFPMTHLKLHLGDGMVLRTSALTALKDEDGVEWGVQGLSEVIVKAGPVSAEELSGRIAQAMKTHCNGQPESEGTAFIVLRWLAKEKSLTVPRDQDASAPLWVDAAPPKEAPAPIEDERTVFLETEPATPPAVIPAPDFAEEAAKREAYLFEGKDWDDPNTDKKAA